MAGWRARRSRWLRPRCPGRRVAAGGGDHGARRIAGRRHGERYRRTPRVALRPPSRRAFLSIASYGRSRVRWDRCGGRPFRVGGGGIVDTRRGRRCIHPRPACTVGTRSAHIFWPSARLSSRRDAVCRPAGADRATRRTGPNDRHLHLARSKLGNSHDRPDRRDGRERDREHRPGWPGVARVGSEPRYRLAGAKSGRGG